MSEFIPLHLRRKDGNNNQKIDGDPVDNIINYKNRIVELEERILQLLDQNGKLMDEVNQLKMIKVDEEKKLAEKPKEKVIIKKINQSKADFIARRSTLQARSSDTLQALRKLALVKERIEQAKRMEKKNQLDVEDKMRLEREIERQPEEED